MQVLYRGPGRKPAVLRRGALRPPRRKKKKKDIAGQAPLPARHEGQGLEVFLSRSWAEKRLFPGLLYSAGVLSAEPGGAEHLPVGKRREVGLITSVAFHLFIILLIALEPILLAPGEEVPELVEEPERLVLFMDEQDPAMQAIPAVPALPMDPLVQGPEAQLLMQEPPRNRLLIPRASRPAPPELQQEFQNSLPFSEGNSDEFYTDEETKDPGKEGEPGEEAPPEEEAGGVEEEVVEPDSTEEGGLDQEGAAEGEETGDSETKLADLLPKDPGFTYFGDNPETPETQPPPQKASPPGRVPALTPRRSADNGEGGERGEGGAFEDIRRFLMGTRFHNLQGGLVTGQDNTFYYDDKGADFVPWLMRLSAEVHRLWISSHPYSASFQAGHTAVGISVLRNGNIAELKRIIPSGVAGFDNFATGSLRAADLLPLPDSYPDERFDIIIVFWFNEQPYDLFP